MFASDVLCGPPFDRISSGEQVDQGDGTTRNPNAGSYTAPKLVAERVGLSAGDEKTSRLLRASAKVNQNGAIRHCGVRVQLLMPALCNIRPDGPKRFLRQASFRQAY